MGTLIDYDHPIISTSYCTKYSTPVAQPNNITGMLGSKTFSVLGVPAANDSTLQIINIVGDEVTTEGI